MRNFALVHPGADTVKRGVSPITLTSSLSSSKLIESNSGFSIKASNNLSDDLKGSFSVDRVKTSNGGSVKNVLFAPVNQSSSSYLLSEQAEPNYANSITPSPSTSQLIKQTLSPLVHHRQIQQQSNSLADMKGSPLKSKPNTVSSNFNNYQLSSNTFIMSSNGNGSKSNFALSTPIDTSKSPIQRTSSPSRSISSYTNTLPSHLGRSNNIQYQNESNYLHKGKPKPVTNLGNATFYNALSSISSSSASATVANQTTTANHATSTSSTNSTNIFAANNIYGTLPKSANTLIHSNAGAAIHGNVSAVANEFEQLIARNSTSNSIGGISNAATNNHGNFNTLGSYRVQYSSTNPFLNHFNPSSNDSDLKLSDDK